ncbi:hypothetical protein ACFE04_009209 [Oxalis oulophora]
MEFLNFLVAEKHFVLCLVPLVFLLWAFERWVVSISNWVPLIVAVWSTLQYSSYQRRVLEDDLDRKWKRVIQRTSTVTPLEQCEWLNKLLIEIWPRYMNPKFSAKFSSVVEKRLKHKRPKFIEKIELQDFSLGSCPPNLGLHGIRWSASSDQQIMRLGFDWDTNDISIMLFAKLAKPLRGTARIVINSLRIKGDLLLMPILDGRAFLYSFVAAPEAKIGIAFGTGGSQSLPATELPGVSPWLVKLLTETLVKTMVEPRRRCFSLPAVPLSKQAVGGIIYVTVISANKLSRSGSRMSGAMSSKFQQNGSSNGSAKRLLDEGELQTLVEVELEELSRRTNVKTGSSPKWGSTFNMVLHDEAGVLRFHLYEYTPNGVQYDHIASCEIKLKYVSDGSTTFWAIGNDSGVIAKLAESCGKEVEMVVPFEGDNLGELTVRLVLKEWQFSDGSCTSNNFHLSPQQSLYGASNFLPTTGRKILINVVEGKDLVAKEKSGKCNPYVKLQYGKALHRTNTAFGSNPTWNEQFEFDEIGGGEYLKVRCFHEETFGDDSIGSARVNLEGLEEGSSRDVWVPLEKVNTGDLRLRVDVVKADNFEGLKGSQNGWIELVLIEARDLIAADLRGTSDPFVKVHYGNIKKSTKVMNKTLSPQWHQTLEFPDDGSSLVLHVKDHNNLLPTSNIGDCVVEYQRLPPNQMADKWIPLQGVKRGEIHIQITRKVPELERKTTGDSQPSLTKAHQISAQMKQMMTKFQSLIEDANLEGLSASLSELESLEDMQEEYMIQLETEQSLLINKITELGQEMFDTSPSPSRKSSGNCHRPGKELQTVEAAVVVGCLGEVDDGGTDAISRQNKEIFNQLKHLNKPYVKSIKSSDGDIIDCVKFTDQPAFDHPLLKNHTIKFSPTFDLEWEQRKQTGEEPITQLWQLSGSCPDGTVPIKRTKKSDVLKEFSFIETNLSTNGKQFSQVAYEEAVAYVHGGKYFGAKGNMDVWNPRVQKDELSKSIISISASNNANKIVDSIEVGWHVNPRMNGDFETRDFHAWTNNGFKTVCYNLQCGGFVQVSKKVAAGGVSTPYSTYGTAPISMNLTIKQDRVTGDWWFIADKEPVGYWPKKLFNHLQKGASMVTWGGRIKNNNYNSKHTITQMGSGHFSNEGYGKANLINNMFIVDEHNKAQRPLLVDHMTHDKCYDVKHVSDSSGISIYFGGPGRNKKCR